jgi:hypothetical protein
MHNLALYILTLLSLIFNHEDVPLPSNYMVLQPTVTIMRTSSTIICEEALIQHSICVIDTLHIKKARLLRVCSLSFQLRHRDQSTIPHFLQFQQHACYNDAKRIYWQVSFCLLHVWIHHTRQELNVVSVKLLELHRLVIGARVIILSPFYGVWLVMGFGWSDLLDPLI